MTDSPVKLSPKFPDSFAYFTLKDRLPVIITKIIDYLYRDRDIIAHVYGKSAKNEVKEITGRLAKLKNEMQTDKPLIPLSVESSDTVTWNQSLLELSNKMIDTPTWYTAPWLYIETYMYRRIYEAFENSDSLKDFDYFQNQKEDALMSSADALVTLSHHLQNVLIDENEDGKIRKNLSDLIKISLWSNKCDLSISAGVENSQKTDPVTSLSTLEPYILVDDSTLITEFIFNTKRKNSEGLRIDIVLDNAGFELFCDLCLAHFLCEKKLAKRIRFYVKRIPWYISDVTAKDFTWVINSVKQVKENVQSLNQLSETWQKYVNDATWTIETEPFWTYPYSFSEMKETDANLYKKLSEADLIIFKGDLNYRKLTGDRQWNYSTSFETALAGFNPSPLCALRTLKADTVVGLEPNQAETVGKSNKDWLILGDYAVIQFTQSIS